MNAKPLVGDGPGGSNPGDTYVRWQDFIRPDHGLSAVDDLSSGHHTLGANHRIRTLSCTEQFRVMAFAQLTYRENLLDMEACLSAQTTKLYHMGFREPIKRSTLANANEARDWHIYADFAQMLICQARALYAQDRFSVDLSNTVYVQNAATIDLCLPISP